MTQIAVQIPQLAIEDIYECPICLFEIDNNNNNNKVTTECGHTFHCRCLMQNIAHNGFTCPLCRSIMIDEVNEDSDDDSEYTRDDDNDTENSVSVAGPGLEAHVLRGMRWMFQRVEGDDEYDDESIWETDSESSIFYTDEDLNHYELPAN